MAQFEGSIRIRNHADKGIMLDIGTETSTLTAVDAVEILTTAVAAADQYKTGLDRWSFYIPEVAVKLPKGQAQMSVAQVKDALKNGNVPTLNKGKWGKPVLVVAQPVTSTVRASKFIADIA